MCAHHYTHQWAEAQRTMSGTYPRKLAEIDFTANVVRETSFGIESRHPDTKSHAILYQHQSCFEVEWDAGDAGVANIGVWTEAGSRKIVDYDGVFSMPREIARFLAQQGFDLSELFDSQPELREVCA